MSVVIDANLVVSLVLPLPYSAAFHDQLIAWKRQQQTLAAPALLPYEVGTALRKAQVLGYLSAAELIQALQAIWNLNIELLPPSRELEQQALAWAERLGQSKVYDAAYLAAAQELQAEFWTADRRLAAAAHQAGARWVHGIPIN